MGSGWAGIASWRLSAVWSLAQRERSLAGRSLLGACVAMYPLATASRNAVAVVAPLAVRQGAKNHRSSRAAVPGAPGVGTTARRMGSESRAAIGSTATTCTAYVARKPAPASRSCHSVPSSCGWTRGISRIGRCVWNWCTPHSLHFVMRTSWASSADVALRGQCGLWDR